MGLERRELHEWSFNGVESIAFWIPAFTGMTKRPEKGLMESSSDFVGVIYFGL